jgi:undecaprenyl-diphosphatase
MSSATDAGGSLTRGRALALGALHGPAELMPISSSGHMTLIPWLLGWSEPDADAEVRKAFEVALHAGTAAALLLGLRGEVTGTARAMTPAFAARLAVATLPAAVVGLAFERPIERRLGTPATIAGGLIAGAVAMAWADRSPQARSADEAGTADALWLGFAQACALMPGVSRNGATVAAARRRRFARADANLLSRRLALPVIGGATLLKSLRLARGGLPAGSAASFTLGAGASFASTLASTSLIRRVERDHPFGSRGRSLVPYAAYRLALAALVVHHARGSA